MTIELHEREAELRAARAAFVRATVVRAERPTSAHVGDRALVTGDGTIEGFVGGVCAETSVRLQALACLASGQSVVLRIDPDVREDGPAAGVADGAGRVIVANPCVSGGALEILLEADLPPPLVWLAGTGPIATALAALGPAVGFEVASAGSDTDALPSDAAAAVVATHGRAEDHVLRAALSSSVPYIGLVASRRRGAAVLAGLGLDPAAAARIHTPAGLDIGARTPSEIALSIYAEIVALRPRSSTTAGDSPSNPSMAAAADPASLVGTAIDPVCGMAVATVSASLHVEHAGVTVWFCGSGCRDAFAADPGRFARTVSGDSSSAVRPPD